MCILRSSSSSAASDDTSVWAGRWAFAKKYTPANSGRSYARNEYVWDDRRGPVGQQLQFFFKLHKQFIGYIQWQLLYSASDYIIEKKRK